MSKIGKTESKVGETENVMELIAKKRVKLSLWESFWHYAIVSFLLVVPIMATWDIIQYFILDSYKGVRGPSDLFWGYLFIIPAMALYYIQRRRLKLISFNIVIDGESFQKAFDITAKELGWSVEIRSDIYIRAHRNWNWSSSWGEMITILRTKDQILINSICDPHAVFASFISFGWNKRNVQKFVGNIQKNVAAPS